MAVGLAGNVLQFVQSASTVIALTREIRKTGASSALEDFKRRTKALAQQTTTIRDHLETGSTEENRLPEDQVSSVSTSENSVLIGVAHPKSCFGMSNDNRQVCQIC